MSMNQILTALREFPGVLELAPQAGSEFPEVSWGDHFFYYSPDATVPRNRQPYATIVTKDYLDDVGSRLDAPDRWRVNIHVGTALFVDLLGFAPGSMETSTVDFSEADVFLPHPLYGSYGWVAVVNPGPHTTARALSALHRAHIADQRRVDRRAASRGADSVRRD